MRLKLIIMMFLFPGYIFSQGGIDHIKNQSYMKLATKIDCDDTNKDELSLRICANLKYQKSDSLLLIVYNKLLSDQTTDSARNYIINLQREWRIFRDKHCSIVWNTYQGGSSNAQAIAYLNCLTDLTNHRRIELEGLVDGE